jgi:heme/copper-type cytochrome/quinol oxidase subunit 3
MQALFVFRENEPITSWLAILLGPATTFLATVVAIFMRKTAGIWLIGSGIAAFLAFNAGQEGATSEHVEPFLSTILLPMLFIGVAFLLFKEVPSQPTATRDGRPSP